MLKLTKTGAVFSSLLGTIILLASPVANAVILSGEHLTAGGKVVDLQGLEWMSLDHTANISPIDIADGFKDRYGNTWKAGEWVYASRLETETLLTSLWGGNFDGWSGDNYDGADWFIQNFGGLGYDEWTGGSRVDNKKTIGNNTWINHDYSNFIFGYEKECSEELNYFCRGNVSTAEAKTSDIYRLNVNTMDIELSYVANSYGVAYFGEENGVGMGIDDFNHSSISSTSSYSFGSLLVRNTFGSEAVEVSEPPGLVIFAFCLLGLVRLRSKKADCSRP